MTDVRVVEVDKEFLTKLKEYLQPDERWVEDVDGRSAILLWAYTDDNRKLQFVQRVEP